MKIYLLILAALLGLLGVFLFWFSTVIENIEISAVERGKAECVAEKSNKQVLENEKKEKVQNVQNYKKAVIWARPNPDWSALIERMRTQGIGTGANTRKKSDLSVSGQRGS